MNRSINLLTAAVCVTSTAVMTNIAVPPVYGEGVETEVYEVGATPSVNLAFYDRDKEVQAPAHVITSKDVLSICSAGAGDVTDSGVDLTDEEVQGYIYAAENAWKSEGALVMADVNQSVNMREEPDETSELTGKLYKDCGGTIIEYTDEWTKIKSGEAVGWVSNDYLLFADEAQALYEEVGCLQAKVNGQTLRVRVDASTDSEVLGMVTEGDVFEVVSQEDGWVAIDFEGEDAYISAEYVDLSYKIDHGETIEKIKAREKAEAEAKARAAKQEASRHKTFGAYAADADDVTLLAALIQCEAGNQSYEGKLAVGAVVMNRVRSGAYPSTLYSVIYASGQFSPAGSGKVDRAIASGNLKSSCVQAAREALSGTSNVGTATHFKRAGAHEGIVIGGHVFW